MNIVYNGHTSIECALELLVSSSTVTVKYTSNYCEGYRSDFNRTTKVITLKVSNTPLVGQVG